VSRLSLPLAALLSSAPSFAPLSPPRELAWRVIVPFDASETQLLEKWWAEHASVLGATASIERTPELAATDLAPGTLLLGFERGQLEEIAQDGDLGAPIATLALESWAPVWSTKDGESGEALELDSFEALLSSKLHGRIQLRSVTPESPEGLILGDLARRFDLVSEEELSRLVLASWDSGTIAGATRSLDALLESLPGGAASIAPVRCAMRARKAGARLGWVRPKEGFLALELACAPTKGSSSEQVRWFTDRFGREVAPQIVKTLELEPAGPLAASAPEWMKLVAGARSEIDRAAAGTLRVRLARLYRTAIPSEGPPSSIRLVDLLDTLLLTLFLAGALVFWWKTRQRTRGA